MALEKIEVNMRVRRANKIGCCGTVKDVRTEVTKARNEKKDNDRNSLMINVQWDNGTVSYLAPDALEAAS